MAETVIRVLYVDDDVALVRLVQKALGRRGFEVAHAANGDEALAANRLQGRSTSSRSTTILATGTGLDFLARLASVDLPPPVVYVTGLFGNERRGGGAEGRRRRLRAEDGGRRLPRPARLGPRAGRGEGAPPGAEGSGRERGARGARPGGDPSRGGQPSRREQPIPRFLAGQPAGEGSQRPECEGRARRDAGAHLRHLARPQTALQLGRCARRRA